MSVTDFGSLRASKDGPATAEKYFASSLVSSTTSATGKGFDVATARGNRRASSRRSAAIPTTTVVASR